MIVVGLDLSLTSAGIAILRDGELAAPLRSVGSDVASNYDQRRRRITSHTTAIMEAIGRSKWPISGGKPDLAVIEGPSYGSQFGDQFDRAALWWGVYAALASKAHKIPIAVIAPNSLKLWWTGDGTADKLRMLDTARARVRPAVSDHDQADALALAYAGAWRLGDPVPFEPCERSVAALERVEWPVIA
jgi:Holliday junction resolvasome RuvABC endonuclease subunit